MTELAGWLCGAFYTRTRCDGSWLTTVEQSRAAVAQMKAMGLTGPRQRPRNPNRASALQLARTMEQQRMRLRRGARS
jgi:hypothetical protein